MDINHASQSVKIAKRRLLLQMYEKGGQGARGGQDLCLEGKTWPWVPAACQQSIFSITLRIHKHYILVRGPWTSSGPMQNPNNPRACHNVFSQNAIKTFFQRHNRMWTLLVLPKRRFLKQDVLGSFDIDVSEQLCVKQVWQKGASITPTLMKGFCSYRHSNVHTHMHLLT